MKIEATSVDDYISKIPDDRAEIITTIREMILPHLDAEETLTYGMPSFHNKAKTGGFSIASQKNYVSLYVMNVELLDTYREHFKHLKPGKSCINFKRLDQLPLDIVQEMIEKSYES